MPTISTSLLAGQRSWFHAELIRRGVLAINDAGIATNADGSNLASRAIASSLARRLMGEVHVSERQAGQTSEPNSRRFLLSA